MAGRTPNDPLMNALAHPLRVEILRRTSRPTAPKDLADELDEPLGNVSYHVRMLAEAGLLELDRTEPARGALKHYYRRTRTAKRKVAAASQKLGTLADAM